MQRICVSLFRRELEANLKTDFNAIKRAELDYFQRNNSIVLAEADLIHECLMYVYTLNIERTRLEIEISLYFITYCLSVTKTVGS